MAVKINHLMPLHTVERLVSLLERPLKSTKILVCGVSYREDIGDSRFSPSEILVRELIKKGGKVYCHDPYLTYWDELDLALLKELPKPANYNAVIIVNYLFNFNFRRSIIFMIFKTSCIKLF